jgi:glycosyltransferase involved in cell wall biosynthesis
MNLKSITMKINRATRFISTGPPILLQLGKGILGFPFLPDLYYVSPQTGWITDWIGHYITSELNQQFNWHAHQTFVPNFLIGQIIHYGELGTYLHFLNSPWNKRNTILITVFHGDRSSSFPELSQAINTLLENCDLPEKIITACQIMRKRMLSWGIPEDKITCIPLGIDLSLFHTATQGEKTTQRIKLDIPENAICIGSFQKDGVGWQKGLEPKLIKGPDIFLQVIAQLHQQQDIFVLLSGPARGYIIRGLEKLGVPHRHIFLDDFRNIPNLYHCLDLYLVTSREEGGPSSVLESLACGIPIVSTRVGLAPDVIQHQRNGFLADIEQVDQIVEYCQLLFNDSNLYQSVKENGLRDIVQYDWKLIAGRYYKEIYQPLRNA